jgi:transposase
LPTEAVDEVVEHWPGRCACGHLFSERELERGVLVARHQVEELPELATGVIEHQLRRVRCPDCGCEARGELPAAVAGSAFGPRLQAAVAVLAVRNRVSRRDTVELCEELFGARIASGTVDAILARAGEALAEPYEQLADCTRRSKHLNVDETGWRLRGQQRTLWGAFSQRHAVFRIAESRHADHAKTLLEGHQGIVTSDRWWAYDQLPLARRQICWAHLRRDFKAHAEGIGAEREFGQAGLRITDQLFWAWEIYQHTHDRKELQRRIRLLRRELKPICRCYAGKAPRYKYCRGIARNLLKVWPALWTFADKPGVEPTKQPRRALAPRRRHLPQALTRQPIRTRRTANRATPLRLDHLPPAKPLAIRLPQRTTRRPQPRQPSPNTRLSAGTERLPYS